MKVKSLIVIAASAVSIGWSFANTHMHDCFCPCYEGNPKRPDWLKRLDKWVEKHEV